jgi:hypothetical protein
MPYKCPYCPRTFSTRSACSQHASYCPPPYISSSSEESVSINDISEISLDDQNIEINENDQSMSISEGSDRSFLTSETDSNEDPAFEDILDILEKSESEISSDQSMSISEGGDQSLLISETDSNEDPAFEDILDILEESESEVNVNYPNEAYGDLMTLVTKHKLNNKAGNAIIRFFNKHANLATSPLPTSIEQGRTYMDKMNIPSLAYKQTCVMNYNNKEYFLHHRSILNCLKNILSIPDISQNFVLTFDNLKVIISVKYMQIL